MAWTEQLPSGKYRGRYRDSAGALQSVTDGGRGYARKRDALHAAEEEEVKSRRRAANSRTSGSITWGKWWDQLIEDLVDAPSDTAHQERGYAENHIRSYWGAEPLNGIRSRDVRAWIRELQRYRTAKGRPLAASTIRRIYEIFAKSINAAVAEEILDASPLAGVKLPPVPVVPKAYTTDVSLAPYLAPDGLRADYARALEFLHETGLRPGELAGMHPNQVDGDWLLVTNVYVERRKLIRPWPKNRRARQVPLTTRARAILAEAMAERGMTGGCGVEHSDGSRCRSDLVFRTVRGGLMRPGNLYQRIAYATSKGVGEATTPYAARRGFITWAAPGVDPFALQKIAGHSDEDQTAGYHQLTPAELARLRVARGEGVQLDVVEQRGADRGAEPRQDVADDGRRDSDGQAG